MLKSNYLESVPDRLVELYAEIEADILAEMAQRISRYIDFIPSAEYQYRKLLEMGAIHDEILKKLSSISGIRINILERIMREAGVKAIESDIDVYRKAGLDPTPLDASPSLQAILQAGIDNTNGLFDNLTKTTASTATRQFEHALDRAWMQISTGAFSPNEAITMAVKDLASKGIESVSYPSGRTDTLETSVRRAVITGVNQSALKMQERLADEMGCDLMQLSAHAGARTSKGEHGPANHSWWQGKIVSRSGQPGYLTLADIGYKTGQGFGGWNCRHNWTPTFLGMEPVYTAEELKELNAPKYEYNGEKLTEYEAIQKQRYIERNIRRYKREYVGMKAANKSTEAAASKLAKWKYIEKDFMQQTGLKLQAERSVVGAFGRKEAAKVGAVDMRDYSLMKSVLGEDKVPQSLVDFKRLKYNNPEEYKALRVELRKTFSSLDYDEANNGRVDDITARFWYNWHDKGILKQIDKSLPIEDQARQAHALRNMYRTQTREMMWDQELRAYLDKKHPNETFEQTLKNKMEGKKLTREEAILDILRTAPKANKEVNDLLGLEE